MDSLDKPYFLDTVYLFGSEKEHSFGGVPFFMDSIQILRLRVALVLRLNLKPRFYLFVIL